MPATPVVLADLTTAVIDGPGVFDVLMRANKAHLESEFTKGRIKGPEYATVYLGSLEAVLKASLEWLLQRDKVNQEVKLLTEQTANAVLEGKVLVAQECKLRAEYDVLMLTKQKTIEETNLLLWKTNTEKAQTTSGSASNDSVIGKQKELYAAQTAGFARDAEQKAAKALIDTWNVRRTTDEGLMADPAQLGDATVARVVNKLLAGVGA